MYQAQIAALKQQQVVDSYFAAGQEAANQAKQKHDQALAAALASDKQGEQGLQAQLKDINQNRLMALVGVVDPAVRDRVNATYDQQIRDAVKRANDQLPHGATATGQTAEKIARDAANAQQALTQALIAQQAALSPTAAIWAKYNATVEKANEDAAKAKLAHGANAQSIDTVRDAVVQGAAAVRDAALDKLTEKDQQAWEQVRASLGNPIDVHAEQAIAKIQKLGELIDNLKGKTGAPGSQDFNAELSKIIDQSLPKTPRTQSLRGLPGGDVSTDESPLGYAMRDIATQTSAYQQAQAILEKERQAALQQYAGDRERELQIQQQFDAKQQQLTNEHSATMAQLQQAQYWGEVQVASDAFGQLAQVWAQRYGTENRTYAVLFALSKTFAIAQAAVSLATNVAKASEVGFPYNIPFIIGAFAQGAEIASLIAGANFSGGAGGAGGGGYSEGGWTGPGSKFQVAGLVHADEGVFSKEDMRALGGPAGFYALRRAIHNGYADGGVVSPYANAPSPASLGFAAPSQPNVNMRDFAANDDAHDRQPQIHVKTVVVQNADQLAEEILNTPTGTKLVIQHVGNNGNQIRGQWSAG
jgi:hypothetical protein